MSYLRFTPDEYRLVSQSCRELQLGARHRRAFKRLLVESLAGPAPELAARIAGLRRGELRVLHEHFRAWPRSSPAGGQRGEGEGHDLTAEELRVVAAACVWAPFSVRFVRPFKGILVDLFREACPELAAKLTRMSGERFERLYEQVCGLGRGKA